MGESDDKNDQLPPEVLEALTKDLTWEEPKVPHLPLRLKPGLAERDQEIDRLRAEIVRLREALTVVRPLTEMRAKAEWPLGGNDTNMLAVIDKALG